MKIQFASNLVAGGRVEQPPAPLRVKKSPKTVWIFRIESLMNHFHVFGNLPIEIRLFDSRVEHFKQFEELRERPEKREKRAHASGFFALKSEKNFSQYMILPSLKAAIATVASTSPVQVKTAMSD